MASPPTITVQAPHSPTPHPYLGPLMFNTSRSTHSRGISGDTSIVAATLLTFILMGIVHSTIRRGERIGHELRLGVYQISAFDFRPEAHRTASRVGERGLSRDFRVEPGACTPRFSTRFLSTFTAPGFFYPCG